MSICELSTTLQLVVLLGNSPVTLLFAGYGPRIHWKLGMVRM